MELPHSALMEDFLSPRMNEFIFPNNAWSLVSFDENPENLTNPDLLPYQTSFDPSFSFLDGFTVSELESSSIVNNGVVSPLFSWQEDYPSVMGDEGFGSFGRENQSSEGRNNGGKKEVEEAVCFPGLDVGFCGKNSKMKKIEGRPSKNLMAERRRRKRLNDRLSMLRSVVPKISKMDRTSILGDTIDYVKLLLEKLQNLKEGEDDDSNKTTLMEISEGSKPNDAARNTTPKFDVEKREKETRIQICSGSRPGLLLSTLNTLEAFGLEIQHCVISCFNDFSMQASCSQERGQPSLSSDNIKQALFRNSGYVGSCL